MIGVASTPEQRAVVEEFFQLFKTPWDFYDPRKRYEVVIVTGGDIPESEARLVVVYGARKCASLAGERIEGITHGSDVYVEWNNLRLPLYGKAIMFSGAGRQILRHSKSGQKIAYETLGNGQRIIRVGYDLLEEVAYMLSEGQPPQNALIPTLDLHIEMLRNWILETGITVTEIPPVPEGYDFIVCLTHDIDFIGIRRHFLDHSMLGFLYRALVGSSLKFFRGKIGFDKLQENLKAVLLLPLVFLGVSKDPWCQFNRCLEIEDGSPSTFFFIPFKNRAGHGYSNGRAKRRATKYDVEDVGPRAKELSSHGCEIGVHGIDSWHSVECGKEELRRVRETIAATSQGGIGIRMHWLSRNELTFEILDKAGYSYDSTFGYNDAVGFKAGTAQPFKPIGAKELLEIPLHIQDTALFAHGRMNTSEDYAEQLCDQVIENVIRHKGVLTVLWHQRSLGPERLWGNFYKVFLQKLKKNNAWFATGSEVADWYRMRRQATFETDGAHISSGSAFRDRTPEGSPQLHVRSCKPTKGPVLETVLEETCPANESV
jgi:hypothetical protein